MEQSPQKSSIEKKEKINLHILYAEDDDSVRHTMGRLLSLRYEKVTVVTNGQELVDQLLTSGEKFDVVFSDNSMPKKKGLKALEEIRSIPSLKDLPFVLFTTDIGSTQKQTEALGGVFAGKGTTENQDLYSVIENSVGL